MNNISGFGLRVTLVASRTFPAGLNITQFADDSDPIDMPSIQINDNAMGLNGDLVVWNTANPLEVTLNVLPSTADDINLSILLEANRVGRGKISANDNITLTVMYPAGNFVIFSNGVIREGMPSSGVASEGRLKTKTYVFAFENRIGA